MITNKKAPTTVITFSKSFKDSFTKYKPKIAAKFADFLKMKLADPMSRFGGTDGHFTGDGPLGKSGVLHVHLTHDIQILYKRSGKNPTKIELMDIGSHDDFGTGQPPNIKKQKTLAKKLNSMDVDEPLTALKESKIPPGSYPARISGYVSVFEVGGKTFKAKFDSGVRGINIRDHITVTADDIKSNVLGNAKFVKFEE